MDAPRWRDIDDYIQAQPPAVQELLGQVRATIRAAAPEATEGISYQLPTFVLNGNLVHFGAFSKHIGLYPGADGIAAFAEELTPYVHARGSVQFPIDQPLPLALLHRITRFRRDQNLAKPKRSPRRG